jgi:hypothetical protein
MSQLNAFTLGKEGPDQTKAHIFEDVGPTNSAIRCLYPCLTVYPEIPQLQASLCCISIGVQLDQLVVKEGGLMGGVGLED